MKLMDVCFVFFPFTTRPSGTVSCPICMDGYSEVRIHAVICFSCCFLLSGRENGKEGELHNSIRMYGTVQTASLKCRLGF